MVSSGVIPENGLYQWFNQTIYYFHVPLFFICSGYLYQKYSVVDSFGSWRKNAWKKAVALGVPYVTFSTVTWLLKTVFSGSVNSRTGGLAETLLLRPESPYWFLYTLFFIFLVTPTFSHRQVTVSVCFLAMLLKILNLLGIVTGVYAVDTVMQYEVWFVLGMTVCAASLDGKVRKREGAVWGGSLMGVFLLLSVAVYRRDLHVFGLSFYMGLLACAGVILLVVALFWTGRQARLLGLLANYTMPIFLLHTIFAAPLRIVLFNLGIWTPWVHIVLGLLVSIVGPIAAAELMKRFQWLDFFLYPNKYCKVKIRSDSLGR